LGSDADVKAATRTAQVPFPVPAQIPFQLIDWIEAPLFNQAFRQA
jgi:hypothetical protein